jgi:hypothetical protein
LKKFTTRSRDSERNSSTIEVLLVSRIIGWQKNSYSNFKTPARL